MDIIIILGLAAFLLAVLTISIPYIPPDILCQMFFAKDIVMVKKHLWKLGVLSYCCLILLFVLAIVEEVTKPIARNIGGHIGVLVSIVATFIVFGIIAFLIIWMRKKAGKEEQEIKRIAYRLWEDEGRPVGRDTEHWLKAKATWEKLKKKE
jgi:hypothetical protein